MTFSLHEMSEPVLGEIQEKYFCMLSDENFTHDAKH